jgi:hypothetical protein
MVAQCWGNVAHYKRMVTQRFGRFLAWIIFYLQRGIYESVVELSYLILNWLGHYLGTICPQVAMNTPTGKCRKTLAGNTKDVFRLIQSNDKTFSQMTCFVGIL